MTKKITVIEETKEVIHKGHQGPAGPAGEKGDGYSAPGPNDEFKMHRINAASDGYELVDDLRGLRLSTKNDAAAALIYKDAHQQEVQLPNGGTFAPTFDTFPVGGRQSLVLIPDSTGGATIPTFDWTGLGTIHSADDLSGMTAETGRGFVEIVRDSAGFWVFGRAI